MPSGSPFPPSARVVAYCRDSGGRDQDLSIPQQEERIGEWCRLHSLALVRVFKDAARSGTSTAGRDAFLEMFSYLTRGADIQGVIFWEYARFSRHYDDTMYYLADLRRQGYAVYSLSDQVPEGLEGRLMEGIIAWKNARYSADLSRNIRRGLAYVVTAFHGWPWPQPPYGFRKVYTEHGTKRDGSPRLVAHLEPDPEKLPILRRIFELRAAGWSIKEIRQAVPVFSSLTSYTDLLSDLIYTGTYAHAGLHVENYIPAVIDPPTFDRVQELWATVHPRRISSAYALSGLVHCALCGSLMSGLPVTRPQMRYEYYICRSRKYKDACPARTIPRRLLEERVRVRLVELLDRPSLLADLAAEMADQAARRDGARQALFSTANKDLDRIEKSIRNITEAIRAAGHSQALIDDLARLEDERDAARQKIIELEARAPAPPPSVDLAELAADLRASIAAASGADLQRLFRLVVDRIDALYTGELSGTLRYTIGGVSGSLSL